MNIRVFVGVLLGGIVGSVAVCLVVGYLWSDALANVLAIPGGMGSVLLANWAEERWR